VGLRPIRAAVLACGETLKKFAVVDNCATNAGMRVSPMPIRLEKELIELLKEGARRTPHKKQELVRLTLRRHLQEVIEEEATRPPKGRVTNVEPWPKGLLTKIYKEIEHEGWDKVEEAAVRAGQTHPPSFDD
jgi:hypothetical protein